MRPISPLGKVKLAVTVDDLLLWKGIPWATGYNPLSVTRSLTSAFARFGLKGVYAFSGTAPATDDPALLRVFDHWAEEGHWISNHTHYHANLNWLDEHHYVEDIERTEAVIDRWSACSPVKYFRYAMDNWGNTQQKFDAVATYLKLNNYTAAPINVWFYDTEFIGAHYRAVLAGDQMALSGLRDTFVQTAVNQLRHQSAAARTMFGRDPAYIWLIHGTPLAADCIDRILEEFERAGVEFIGLEEAMRDPFNSQPVPLITPRFLNHIQKWADLRSVGIEDCPPAAITEIEKIHPMPGLATPEFMYRVFKAISDEAEGVFFPKMY
ncbi:Uncharacterized conserved protein YibQ, putative polysaccharide deacetylase 2 family [Tardiphaga sp. OK246]|uniref:polysaccharide deacetylase family protein n=1 Tax=Tardiphaga sp. OK246 TaxID=1855307 RepID=UPI000B703B81|nr:polysaccharide deacetylase family protein [Tardiphaga sp. OK246]SNT32001.1 Uncharacterized conserved protein YibQ, putative polysaccharide deacetylase 2 family [Tardiphaga sp. OK246]